MHENLSTDSVSTIGPRGLVAMLLFSFFSHVENSSSVTNAVGYEVDTIVIKLCLEWAERAFYWEGEDSLQEILILFFSWLSIPFHVLYLQLA